jgi:hypothetical protein
VRKTTASEVNTAMHLYHHTGLPRGRNFGPRGCSM